MESTILKYLSQEDYYIYISDPIPFCGLCAIISFILIFIELVTNHSALPEKIKINVTGIDYSDNETTFFNKLFSGLAWILVSGIVAYVAVLFKLFNLKDSFVPCALVVSLSWPLVLEVIISRAKLIIPKKVKE